VTKDLIIIGAGGGSRELIPFASEINSARGKREQWNVIGILDDNVELAGTSVDGVPVLGSLSTIDRFPNAHVVIGIAGYRNVRVRREVYDRLGLDEEHYAALIHPRAYIAPNASIGPGCVIYPNVCIGAGARVDRNTVVYFGSVIHHDAVVGAHSTICAGVVIAGEVTIGSTAYLGASVCIRERVNIGDGARIGIGAVASGDVGAGETVVGHRAKPLSEVRLQATQDERISTHV
jgi:sugar O-acyltransferase (sialic acid O-acetyltransferase NeuD family)